MFERFTDRARRVLVLANEETHLLGDAMVGTEHLLLGLIDEEGGIAATALRDMGFTREQVRSTLLKMRAPTGVPDQHPHSPPFTPRGKKVLELSLREALQFGHSYIGTEHMLLGLIREGEGYGAKVLLAEGRSFMELRKAVIDRMGGRDSVDPKPTRPENLKQALGATSAAPVDPMTVYMLRMENTRLRDQIVRMKMALMVLADGDTPRELALRKAVQALELGDGE